MYKAIEKYGQVRMNSYLPTQRALKYLNYFQSVGWHNCNSQYKRVYPEGIDGALLFFTVAGKGVLQLGEERHYVMAGTITLIPPHTPMLYFTDPEVNWEFYWINLYGAYSIQTVLYMLEEQDSIFKTDNMQNYIDRIEHLILMNYEDKIKFECNISDLIFQLLQDIIKEIVLSSDKSSSQTLPVKISTYIENHYSEPISMAQLSKKFFISQNHLIRTFREVLGYTPYEYLKRHRLLKACELLKATNHTVEEIATKVGFSNYSNFIFQFKAQYGITPCNYRKLIFPISDTLNAHSKAEFI